MSCQHSKNGVACEFNSRLDYFYSQEGNNDAGEPGSSGPHKPGPSGATPEPATSILKAGRACKSAKQLGPFARRRKCFCDKDANQPTRNDCLSKRTSSGSKATTKETRLASVMDSTTVFETVRRGSTPWRGTRLYSPPLEKTDAGQIAGQIVPPTIDLLKRLEAVGVITESNISRVKSGQFSVSFERGPYLDRMPEQINGLNVEDSPLIDGLLSIGFELPAAIRVVRRYPGPSVSQWTDITQAAVEKFGTNHFRVSPMAYLVDSLKQAAKGVRTAPDWWHETKREERRSQRPTEAGKQVLSKLLDEVFGADRPPAQDSAKPERAADLLKQIR